MNKGTARAPSVRDITTGQAVTLDDLKGFAYLPDTLAPHAAPKRARRSDVQIEIDQRVAEVHARWHAEGCQTVWLRQPQAFFPVPREKAKDIRDKIRKAGRLGVRLTGPDGGVTVHMVQIRFGRDDLFDELGQQIISFTVVDKKDGAGENSDLGRRLTPRVAPQIYGSSSWAHGCPDLAAFRIGDHGC